MRKLILGFIFIFLCSLQANAASHIQGGHLQGASVGGGAATPSCAGIWEWTGDHASGEGYSCEGVNAFATDGTDRVDAAYGETGNGFRKTNPGEYMEWANTGTANFNRALGTIWARIRVAEKTQNITVLGLNINVNNIVRFEIRADNGWARASWTGAGDSENHSSAGSSAVANNTWTWVGYTWDISGSKHCVTVDDGATWDTGDCTESDTLTALASDPTDFGIGENDWGLDGATDVDTIDIDRVIIYDTYQAAHP